MGCKIEEQYTPVFIDHREVTMFSITHNESNEKLYALSLAESYKIARLLSLQHYVKNWCSGSVNIA